MQIYIARLQKFSDALTAENKNVFSFAAKVQTVQFNIRMDFCGAEEENGGRGTDSPGGRHPNQTNGNPTTTTSSSFYRPDALPAAQLYGSRLLFYIYRSWPPYLAVVPLSTIWGRGW